MRARPQLLQVKQSKILGEAGQLSQKLPFLLREMKQRWWRFLLIPSTSRISGGIFFGNLKINSSMSTKYSSQSRGDIRY
jgi:hypothetical protein